MIHRQQHDNQGSLEVFRRHAEKNPRDPLLQYLYADALLESPDSGKPEVQAEAIRAGSQAVKLEPDYQPARDLLTVLYMRAGNASAAKQQAEEALKRNPDDTAAIYQEMMADRKLGEKGDIDGLVARLKHSSGVSGRRQPNISWKMCRQLRLDRMGSLREELRLIRGALFC